MEKRKIHWKGFEVKPYPDNHATVCVAAENIKGAIDGVFNDRQNFYITKGSRKLDKSKMQARVNSGTAKWVYYNSTNE